MGVWREGLNSYMLSCWSKDPTREFILWHWSIKGHPDIHKHSQKQQDPRSQMNSTQLHPTRVGHYMTPTQTMHCYEGNPSKRVPFNDPCPTKWHLASCPEQDFLLKLPIQHDPCKECYLKCFIPHDPSPTYILFPWQTSMANVPNKPPHNFEDLKESSESNQKRKRFGGWNSRRLGLKTFQQREICQRLHPAAGVVDIGTMEFWGDFVWKRGSQEHCIFCVFSLKGEWT